MTSRATVDLSGYPDLVVIYLGLQVRALRGVATLLRLGPAVARAVGPKPDGLLHTDLNILFSLFPLHVGFRQYWRDFGALEKWTRELPHQQWWKDFLKDSGGTGFWHETYFVRGGMEAIYLDLSRAPGFGAFAPTYAAKGGMFSARRRLGVAGEGPAAPVKEYE
jgi:hypothetical protein